MLQITSRSLFKSSFLRLFVASRDVPLSRVHQVTTTASALHSGQAVGRRQLSWAGAMSALEPSAIAAVQFREKRSSFETGSLLFLLYYSFYQRVFFPRPSLMNLTSRLLSSSLDVLGR